METKKQLKGLFFRTDYYGAYTQGGMATMFDGLLNGFLNDGHECIFVAGGRMNLPKEIKYYYLPHSSVFVNFPEVLNMPYNEKLIKFLKKIIEQEKPDFIYQFHFDFNYVGAVLKKELGIPFFLQCESVQLWVKSNWGKLYFKHLLKWAEEIQWANADAIFVISEAVKKQMVNMGVPSKKLYVNTSKVNPNVFNPDIDGTKRKKQLGISNKFIVGFTGTFAPWHGVEVLAESIKYLKNDIPELCVLMIGDGMLRPNIEEILKKDNTQNFALLTGSIPFIDMPEYLAMADILVTPCIKTREDTEFFNSPIKLYEYLAMGKPIIASDVGEQATVIIEQKNGLLCPEKNPKILAEKILYLYNNPELANRISIQARKDAVEKYDWIYNSRNVVNVFNNNFK